MSKRLISAISGTAVVVIVTVAVVVNIATSDQDGQVRAADGDAAGQGGGQAVPVQVTTPTRRTLTRELKMPATLLAGEKADLYAKVSGYVTSVDVDIGSRVERGQPLLVIDVPEMADELRRAEAVLAAQQARALQAESMIEIARAEVQRTDAEHDLSHINHERRQALREQNAIPQQELDEAKSELAIADAQVKIARARVVSSEADLAVAKSEAAVAEAAVARLGTLMAYATIKAPFAGIITERLVDPGAFVRSAAEGATTALFSISRMDYIRLVLEIPESDAPSVHVGTAVSIAVKALGGDPIEGKVTRSAIALRPATRTMRVEVDLDNKDGRLAPGMYAQVSVKLESKQQAMMIPSKAIRVRGRDISVLVADDGKAESRPVKIGYDDGIWVEITGGKLGDDDQIIVSASGAVAPGMAVRPVLVDGPGA